MPNKFITNLDLARQAEIFSGETAVFKGGMQLGIPFSGFPTGVDTSTITPLTEGESIITQFAAFSGNTGTTVFNVTDPTSPYYSVSAPVLSASPYTIIDEVSIVETISATTYPTIMSFTAVTGSNGATLNYSFSQPILEALDGSDKYIGLFSNLGGVSIGTTFIDESFYNVGSVFSGANLNMEVVTLGAHASTPAWSTGTTSGTVIEYSAMTQYWADPTIINYTSGLTLPITPESAETQTSDYIWTLTDSTIIDENLIGLKYTGYSITYSFNEVELDPTSPSLTGATGTTSGDTYYYGTVLATYQIYSAGTLDYKGSTNWMKIDGMSTVEERLTVGRMTINNPDTGTSVSSLGIDVDGKVVKYTAATSTAVTGLTFNDTTYDLTLGIDNGTTFTDSLAILASDIKVTGGTFNDTSGEMTFVNNSGGTFVVSGLSTDFTGNTSGTCITDLHISNLHSCSPLYINPLDEGNVYFGSTSGVTIDVANNRVGIGTETPSSQLHIAGSGANTIIRVQSEDQNNAVINLDTQTTGGAGPRNSLVQFQQNSTTQWMIGMNGIAGGTEEAKQLVIANGVDFDTNNILNINPSNGYVGLGVQAPTERLDINGNIKISGGLNLSTLGTATPVNNLAIDASGNVVSGTTGLSIGNPITGGGANRILYQNASQLLTSDDDLLFDGLGFALHTSIDSNKAMSLNGGTSSHYTTLYVQQGSTGTANRYAIEAVGVAGHAFDSVGIKSTAQNTSTGDAIAGEFSATAPTGSGNAYGIKVTSSNVGTGIAYGIYQSGTTAINYFAGQLQLNTIGSTTPVTNLGIDASGNVVSGTTGGSSLWSENSGDGIYFNTSGDSVSIGDTATNGISEGGKLYIKGDSSLTYALKVDREDDGDAVTIDSTTGVVDMNYGATIGLSNMLDVGVTIGTWIKYNPTAAMKFEWQQANVLKARILTQSGYGSFQIYDNAGVSYYKLDGVNNNYENTSQDFTFGTTTSLGARVGIRGTGSGSGTSSLITQDSGGNTTFEVKDDGTVVIPNVGTGTSVTNLGVDASGNVVSGTTGGSSLWTDDGGGKISYGDVGSSVNIYEDTFPNTYGAAVTIERGFLMVGSGNDIGHSVTSTNVSRSVVFGTANILGSEGDAGYNMISGNNNDILSGDYNGSIGQNNITKGDKNFSAGYLNLIYGNNNISLGDTNTIGTSGANVNKSVAIGEDVFVEANDQIVIGFGIDTNASYAATKGIFVGIENGKPNSGWFTDPAINSTANFALGGRDTMRTDVGVIKTGTGAGIFYLANYNNANVTEPSSNAPDAVAMYAKDRDTGKSGLKIKAEDGTNHFFSDFSSIGGDETIATANKTLTIAGTGIGSGTSSLITKDSGGNTTFEVKDDGTVVIPNIGSTTPVTNLGVDASGNVVSGTTGGGGGGGGLNYISAGTVATNLETTSNWDINGVYTGATATGTQADCHVDSDYWFTCVATDTWIRLIRG